MVAEAALWRTRADRHSAETREAYVRAKAAERLLREEQVRCRELEAKMTALLMAKLNEPERVEGCGKVRFHREPEAHDWAGFLAGKSGEPADVFTVYPCKTCPRSPGDHEPLLPYRSSRVGAGPVVQGSGSTGACCPPGAGSPGREAARAAGRPACSRPASQDGRG